MPTNFVMSVSDADLLSLQAATDAFNAAESRRPDAPQPLTALEYLAAQVQMRVLDRYTQVRTDAEQAALVQAVLANPEALQAAQAVLATPMQVPVQAVKIVS